MGAPATGQTVRRQIVCQDHPGDPAVVLCGLQFDGRPIVAPGLGGYPLEFALHSLTRSDFPGPFLAQPTLFYSDMASHFHRLQEPAWGLNTRAYRTQVGLIGLERTPVHVLLQQSNGSPVRSPSSAKRPLRRTQLRRVMRPGRVQLERLVPRRHARQRDGVLRSDQRARRSGRCAAQVLGSGSRRRADARACDVRGHRQGQQGRKNDRTENLKGSALEKREPWPWRESSPTACRPKPSFGSSSPIAHGDLGCSAATVGSLFADKRLGMLALIHSGSEKVEDNLIP